MHPCIRALIIIGAELLALPASTGFAQTSAPASEIDQLKQELRRMQERLQKLEQAPPAPAPAAASTPLIPVAALAICLLFLSAAERKNWIAGGIALAVGALIYAVPRGSPPVAGSEFERREAT